MGFNAKTTWQNHVFWKKENKKLNKKLKMIFSKTELGRQLHYNQETNANIITVIAYFLLGIIVTIGIMAKTINPEWLLNGTLFNTWNGMLSLLLTTYLVLFFTMGAYCVSVFKYIFELEKMLKLHKSGV